MIFFRKLILLYFISLSLLGKTSIASQELVSEPQTKMIPLSQSTNQYSQTFNQFSSILERLASLPCVSDQARKSMQNLILRSSKTNQLVQNQYGTYMKKVKKDMDGSGKCDGGFNSIALESGSRADLSFATKRNVGKIQEVFKDSALRYLIDTAIVFNGSAGEECIELGNKLYVLAENNIHNVYDNLSDVQTSFRLEGERFNQYKEQNTSLASNCGEAEKNSNTSISANQRKTPIEGSRGYTINASRITKKKKQR